MSDEPRDLVAEAIRDNLAANSCIWDLVEKSDPRELKKVTHGRGFIAIDAYPQIEKATKLFGPMGIGFGLSDVTYNIVNDIDVSTSKKPNTTGPVMIMSSTFWYRFPGGTTLGQFPLIIDMVYEGRGDVPKKLITSSISKALSYLGFNYDVFRGSWDDNPHANRPDIPAPEHLIENLKILMRYGVEKKICTKAQVKTVFKLQVDSGWTLQGVQSSYDGILALFKGKGEALPRLLKEDENVGIPENETKVEGAVKDS